MGQLFILIEDVTFQDEDDLDDTGDDRIPHFDGFVPRLLSLERLREYLEHELGDVRDEYEGMLALRTRDMAQLKTLKTLQENADVAAADALSRKIRPALRQRLPLEPIDTVIENHEKACERLTKVLNRLPTLDFSWPEQAQPGDYTYLKNIAPWGLSDKLLFCVNPPKS